MGFTELFFIWLMALVSPPQQSQDRSAHEVGTYQGVRLDSAAAQHRSKSNISNGF